MDTKATSRLPLLALLGLLAAGLVFRLAVCASFSTSSPDGDQYYALSQSLLRDGRYAYGPPPRALTHTRLPGYPLLVAALDGRPRAHADHVRRAALANAVFDVATALLLALLALRIDGWWSAGLAVVGVLLCPQMLLHSIGALSESFATLLSTAELCLLVGVLRARRGSAAAAGVVAGLFQLVRLDGLTLVPSALLATFWSPGGARARARTGAVILGAALVVFSPWPIRNLVDFGHPYPEGTEWLDQRGDTLPTGMIQWMRTWCTSAPGEAKLSDMVVFGHPFSSRTPGALLPRMYDSPAERARLARLIDHVGTKGLDARADAEFSRLARERAEQHPLRTFVRLPLERIKYLLSPTDPRALHWIRIPLLGWPQSFALFPVFFLLAYLLAPLGTVRLVRAGHGRIVAVLWAAVAARVALYSFAVPHQVAPRYLVEAFPVLILFASCGAVWLGRLAWSAGGTVLARASLPRRR